MLTPDEQREAIVRLADSGMSEWCIAAATKLNVEFIRIIIGERGKAAA